VCACRNSAPCFQRPGVLFVHARLFRRSSGTDAAINPGIYSLDDLKTLGKERHWCPYFLTRHVINLANVIVYNYQVCVCVW